MNLGLQISTTFSVTFSKKPNRKKKKKKDKDEGWVKLQISVQKFHISLFKTAPFFSTIVFFLSCSICDSPFSFFSFIQGEGE